MAQAAHHRFTFEDYVQIDVAPDLKLEFLDGQVWAMSGGTPAHAAMCAALTMLLGMALRDQPCRTFSADLRIRVKATGLGTYPDVSVVCGALELDPDDPKRHTVVNPRVLVEVSSPSTEAYDRGEKLAHYQQIPSLGEIVFVAHDRREIEIVRREADGSWSRHVAKDGEVARLVTIACDLPLAEVYRDPLAAPDAGQA
jgi:Uma2 family endonuclease